MSKIEIRNHPKFPNVFISGPQDRLKLYTKNAVIGKRIYGERLVNYRGIEYREWDPFRSKIAALVLGNPITKFLDENLKCLYLGASSGTSISHLSDIIQSGIIYSVEFAERSMRQLLQNTSDRNNIIPILGDARFPEEYSKNIFTEIDLIYQDVAQPNQAEIALSNCNYYLKNDGILIIAIKSQSIDSLQKSELIYDQEKKILENSGYSIIESVNIHKYAANHNIIVVKKSY
jgi:fibrillarin-like pre-rRNA processing protein